MTRDKVLTVLLCGVAMAVHPGAPLWGAPIPLANASFESPAVAFVSTQIDGWQKTPKPESYDESDGFLWSQLTGLFRNTPAGSADHIDNCDGNQAIWVFAVPGAGLFQESSPSAGGGLAPQTLTGSFEVGRAYQLSAGVIGMGGGMSNGVTLGIGLYYRDAASNQVVVAEAIATNSPAVFSNRTHLVEFRAELPTVRTQDPWANQPIGIRLLSTVGAQLQGGYWDLDNIRLREIRAPVLGLRPAGGEGLALSVESETGLVLEILGAGRLDAPPGGWVPLTTVTNESGRVPVPIPAAQEAAWYYRARELGAE